MKGFFLERREQLDKTQRSIALELNLTTSAVSDWERGISFPRREIWPAVAKAYRVKLDRIIAEYAKPAKQEARPSVQVDSGSRTRKEAEPHASDKAV